MNDGKNETQLLKEILTTVNNTSQQVTNISRIIGELKVRQEYIDKDHERVVEQQKITSHDISKLKSDRDLLALSHLQHLLISVLRTINKRLPLLNKRLSKG